ncbi:MAG: hypothetical protein GX838_01785 [Clostridiaceae bacterium]|nr:hypothetical protein [Clostridiaceae bacterium]
MMKHPYEAIIRHIPDLEDHGPLFMYYGEPLSDDYLIYGGKGGFDKLVVSYDCDDLCHSIAQAFERDYDWLDILKDKGIRLEDIFELEVETQDFEAIVSLLLYLLTSTLLEDKLIDSFQNGYMFRLLKRLDALVKAGALPGESPPLE